MGLRGRWLKLGLAASVLVSPVIPWGNAEARASDNQPTGFSFASAETARTLPDGRDDIIPGKVLVKYKDQASMPAGAMLLSASDEKGFVVLPVEERESVASAVDRLRKDPSVAYAEPVYNMRFAEVRQPSGDPRNLTVTSSIYEPNDPKYMSKEQWDATVTGMTYAWEHVQNRSGVTIAIVDSGVNRSHEDLMNSMLPGLDLFNNDDIPEDDIGHGTMVAGLAAAVADNGKGLAGAAGGVRILPVKVGGVRNGQELLPTDTVAAGIKWAVDQGADVINLSLGSRSYSAIVQEAIQYALTRKVVVVAASGNASNHWIGNEAGNMNKQTDDNVRRAYLTDYPALFDGVIAVGAVTKLPSGDWTIADFSNVGKIAAVAPGVNMVSTSARADNVSYAAGSGTSFSSPLVAGLAALIKAKDPSLTSDEVRHILSDSASTLNPPGVSGYEDGYTPNYKEYYGGGMMNGEKSFTMPRLKLEATQVQNAHKINATIKAVDDSGNILTGLSDNVAIYITRPLGKSSNTVVKLVYGKGDVSIDYPESDVYYVGLQANDRPDSGNVYAESVSMPFVQRPTAPAASLSSGSYTGKQTVTLSTATPEAQIYYTLDGSSPSVSTGTLYTGALSITANTTIRAVALKNGIYSESRTYDYSITPSSSGGRGGGGGFVSPPNANNAETGAKPDADGVLKVVPDKKRLLEQIASAKGEPVTIDARTDTPFNRLTVELPGEVWRKAASEGTPIRIASNQVTFIVPAGAFAVGSDAAAVTLTAAALGSADADAAGKPSYAALASTVFDFKLQVDDQNITAFNKSISAELQYSTSKVTEPAKTGVYYFNERAGAWEYVGGKADNGTIRVGLDHFSKYAVLEWNRTFGDITNHWARQQIERMAAKQIADGMTDTAFAPDAQITRAQFAALLTRTLKLKTDAASLPFADVPADAWYRDAVSKAYEAKLISGVSDTTFAPEQNITREQMAVMLMNAYSYATGTDPDPTVITQQVRFVDQGTISSWAIRPALLASASGLMEGNPDGSFAPREQATRAQAITVLSRLLEKIQG